MGDSRRKVCHTFELSETQGIERFAPALSAQLRQQIGHGCFGRTRIGNYWTHLWMSRQAYLERRIQQNRTGHHTVCRKHKWRLSRKESCRCRTWVHRMWVSYRRCWYKMWTWRGWRWVLVDGSNTLRKAHIESKWGHSQCQIWKWGLSLVCRGLLSQRSCLCQWCFQTCLVEWP